MPKPFARPLLLAGLAACSVLAWLALRAGPAGEEGLELAPSAGSAPVPSSGALRGEGAGELLAPAAAPLDRPTGVRPGVRLVGEGRLTGVLLSRADRVPIPGALVHLYALPPATRGFLARVLGAAALQREYLARTEPVATVGTDALGGFEFRGVRAGSWYADVEGAYWVADGPVRALVAASGEGGPLTLWARVGGRVLGRALRPNGEPAGGARVMLTTGAEVFLTAAQRGELEMLETEADAEGRFAFRAVPPGAGYELSAIGGGLAVSHLLGVDVAAGEDTEVTLLGRAGGTVRGRLLSGPPPGGTGELLPLEGARVGAVPRGLRHLRLAREILLMTHAVSGPDGGFELCGVPEGEVDLVAMAQDHVPGKGPALAVARGGLASASDFTLVRGPTVAGQVVDSLGDPVAGAEIRWNPVDLREVEGSFSLAPLLLQALPEFEFPVTDADGRFVAGPFAGEPPYLILAIKAAYDEGRVRWTPGAGAEARIVLRRGGGVEGIVMDLEAAAPVTRFTLITPDRIESELGAPGRLNPFAGGRLVEHPEGRFTLDGLAPGPARLVVSAEGYLDQPLDLEVAEGELLRGVIVTLSSGGVVRGRVVDPDGAPVAGARVTTDRVLERFDEFIRGRRARVRDDYEVPIPTRQRGGPEQLFVRYATSLGLVTGGVATSAPDGAFELVGLTPGPQRVFAFHRDWQVAQQGPHSVAVGAPVEGVLLTMTAGATVYGTVRDPRGRPIEGAMVTALAPAGLAGSRAAGGALFQGRSDAQGCYEIRHLEPGGYLLALMRGDEGLSFASLFGTLNVDVVSVPAGQRVRHDLVDTSAGTCRVYGVVTSEGRPLTRGGIVALGYEAPGVFGVDVKITNIENDGRYEFEGLAPGEYRFQIDGAGPRSQLIVDVPDALELHLDLALPDGRLGGRVVDGAGGSPVASARVAARPLDAPPSAGLFGELLAREGGVRRVRTDAEGRFELGRLAAGRYALEVEPPRAGPAAGRWAPPEPLVVELLADERRVDLELALEPALALEGTVVDEDGAPVAAARLAVHAVSRSAARPAAAVADASGRFRVDGLGPGAHTLSAEAEGYATSRLSDLVLERGVAPEPLRVVLARGARVTVRVVDGRGDPVAGATARLRRVDDGGEADGAGGADVGQVFRSFFSGGLVTDEDGRLGLGRYGPGPYLLEVRQGLARTEREVELPAGAEALEVGVRLD